MALVRALQAFRGLGFLSAVTLVAKAAPQLNSWPTCIGVVPPIVRGTIKLVTDASAARGT